MHDFSSARERRLWAWALAVAAAIYATLPLASVAVSWLRAAGLLDVVNTALAAVFLGCMVLIGVMVLTEGLRVRPGGVEIGAGIGILAAYALLFVRMALVTERSHLIEYSVLAVFVYEALHERRSQGRRVPVPGLLAWGLTTAVGVLDECIQAFLPSRVFDTEDIVFNTLAAAMAVVAMAVLRRAREAVR